MRESRERALHDAIPGAVHAPWGLLEFWDELTDAYYRAQRQRNGCVVLCCASGGRSGPAANILRHLGYANVFHLEGGLVAWRAAGRSVAGAPRS